MKKFEFRLQKLLDIRKSRERDVQNELAKVVAIQNIERMKQREINDRLEIQKTRFTEKFRGGLFNYSEIQVFERFIEFAHRAIQVQQERIDSMEPEIQKIRERLVEASRELRVVEKLKERKWDEYCYEMNREIAKENDDMNQKIFLKKRAELMV